MGFMKLSNKHFVFALLFMGCLGHPVLSTALTLLLLMPHLPGQQWECEGFHVPLPTRSGFPGRERWIRIHPHILRAPSSRLNLICLSCLPADLP